MAGFFMLRVPPHLKEMRKLIRTHRIARCSDPENYGCARSLPCPFFIVNKNEALRFVNIFGMVGCQHFAQSDLSTPPSLCCQGWSTFPMTTLFAVFTISPKNRGMAGWAHIVA
jgi:hypothetical protein